jgi:hypothetical protein
LGVFSAFKHSSLHILLLLNHPQLSQDSYLTMQLLSVVSVALLGFAAAAPVAEPQDIDFDAYNAIPAAPDLTAPVGVVPQVVNYSPAGAAASAAAASISDLSKRGSCLPEPVGNYRKNHSSTKLLLLLQRPALTLSSSPEPDLQHRENEDIKF